MIDIDRLLSRLKTMSQYLQRLQQFESITLQEYQNNYDNKLIVERLLELTIQSSIDINNHIISKHFSLNSVEAKQSFLLLVTHKVLEKQLGEELSKSVNFRNLLAHEYLDVNDQIVLNIIPLALKQYQIYIQQIKAYLDFLGQNNG